MPANWAEQLAQGLRSMGLKADQDQQQLLLDYLALLQKWNRAFNLTAIRDPGIMVSRQLLDSLSIHPLLQGDRVLDVGSGAGLPGLPLAIMNPERSFTLLDTNSKKTRFLKQARLELGLENLQVEHTRVEQYHPLQLFDSIVSRAFASLPDMLRVTRHLLQPGGCWLAMKATVPVVELDALDPEFRYETHRLMVPGETAQRHAILLESKTSDFSYKR
ncbi:16S rRNA (guanine(527)-N(7))-methyltransferase RsmG [Thiolapillus sp.]